MADCKTCQLMAQRDAAKAPLWDCIYRAEYWDVVHSYNTSLAGWLVLIARRHIEAVAEMTLEEAAECGTLLRRVSLALQEVTGCAKTYVIQFAEHPEHPHVHFHVVPRMADQPPERRAMGIFAYLGVDEAELLSEEDMNAVSQQVQNILLQSE